MYTWHYTMGEHEGAVDLARSYAPLLEAEPRLDPVPPQWLHLTTQGVGFTDEITLDEIAVVVDAAREHCRRLAPVRVEVGPAVVGDEGVMLPVTPVEPLMAVRGALRTALAQARPQVDVPESEQYRPHVSLAYCNTTMPADGVDAALAAHRHRRALTLSTVSLIELVRDGDNRLYRWSPVADIALGAGAEQS
ncbi:2'-5' RNA ligase superfamily protein [Actinosynnema pretiosum]|nr:2'-5' RNA ligase superfamily protein [Actinosynnema pretiosum]